jgi:DNA-directed RNA polymerase specialized sigma24 family protein
MSGFPVTQLSVLERIRSGDQEVRYGAWNELASGYWRPSYHYLRLHWRLPPDEAEDIVQGFFTVAFEKGYLEKFDPAKARFRTFLRTCLDRFLQNQRKTGAALKRGGGTSTLSLDFPGAERDLARVATDLQDLDAFFRHETVRSLLAQAADDLRVACAAEGRDIVYQTFARHDLTEATDRSYASVAADLGIAVTQVTNHLHVARRRFRELALTRLRGLVGTDEEFREEARDLFGVEVDL